MIALRATRAPSASIPSREECVRHGLGEAPRPALRHLARHARTPADWLAYADDARELALHLAAAAEAMACNDVDGAADILAAKAGHASACAWEEALAPEFRSRELATFESEKKAAHTRTEAVRRARFTRDEAARWMLARLREGRFEGGAHESDIVQLADACAAAMATDEDADQCEEHWIWDVALEVATLFEGNAR